MPRFRVSRAFQWVVRRCVAAIDLAATGAHQALRCFYRRDLKGRIIASGVYFFLLALWIGVLALHKRVIPAGWTHLPFFDTATRVVLSLLTLVLLAIPLLLVRYSERKRKGTARELHRAIEESILRVAGTAQKCYVDGTLVHMLLSCASSDAPDLFILTPNGFFICADRLSGLDVRFPPGNQHHAVIETVRQFAGPFRGGLSAFRGVLHILIPDLQDSAVVGAIEARSGRTDLPEELLSSVDEEARDALMEIRRIRTQQRLRTEIRHLPFLPDLRLMAVGDTCFAQLTPHRGLTVAQEVFVIHGTTAQHDVSSIIAMLRAACNAV